MTVRLREYQLAAVNSLMASVARGDTPRMITVAPTGTGRTLVAAYRELLQQPAEKDKRVQ